MRLLMQLRWWKAGDRMGSALISLVAVMLLLLGGCWPVAAPLIGVGVVGGGAAIATTVRTKSDSSPTAAHRGDEVSATPVSETNNSQVLDRASEPVAAGLPTSTLAVSPPPSAAAEEVSPRTPPGRPSAEVVAESSRPKPSKNARPVVIVTPSLAAPDDLPPTVIVH